MWSSDKEYIMNLKYKVKALYNRLEAFESGEMYSKIKSNYEKIIRENNYTIKELKNEIYSLRTHHSKNIKDWMEVNESLFDECQRTVSRKDKIIDKLNKHIISLYHKNDKLSDEIKELTKKVTELTEELEDEIGKNQKLTAQINRDFENSSIPSSLSMNHKKIYNGRVKTGRSVGGQLGHVGHGRKKQTPTHTIIIPTPQEYLDSTLYEPTGKTIKRQMVNVKVNLLVDEYETQEYKNIKTGKYVHAPFPEGVENDVNYGGSIKAFTFILNNRCNVSIAKTKEFFSEITEGELEISTGMINGLSKKFSEATNEDRKEAFLNLLTSPVMHTDFTTAKVNGKQAQVAICADSEARQVGYYARSSKGHKGIAGTPVEGYQLTLVHDHDLTYYKYGSQHQECIVHCLRYVRDTVENESHLSWNKQMYEIIQEMIHYRKSLTEEELDPDVVKDFEKRYDACLELAKSEYENNPPTKYYMEGYNLYIRLAKYKESHLLFLHNKKVPYDNNSVERLARVFKRKQKSMTVFRSFDSLEYLCNSLGIMQSILSRDKNLYEEVTKIFDRKKPDTKLA